MHERETIQLIRGRDERGASDLLLYYGPLLRYVIAPILPSEQDREECLSEVAMQVWTKIDSYDPQRGRWTTWLTVLARNAALNRARRARGPSARAIWTVTAKRAAVCSWRPWNCAGHCSVRSIPFP